MQLLKNKKLCIFVTLFIVTNVFAEEKPLLNRQTQQGESTCKKYTHQEKTNHKTLAKESQVSTDIGVSSYCHLFASGSFIYWNAIQENMELGIVSTNPAGSFTFSMNGNLEKMDFDFKPGFKVGFGGNFPQNNWDLYLQYTWFRGTNHKNVSLNTAGNDVLFPRWQVPTITSPTYFSAQEIWRLEMDLLDLEMGKDHYTATSFSYRAFIGLRAAWIRQKANVNYLNEITGALLAHNVFITERTRSWGLGPRFGLQMNWILGNGIRLYGSGSGDILFTQYTSLDFNQEATTTGGAFATSSRFLTKQGSQNYLRGHLELDLGLGWGTNFNNNKNHVDLSADYSFQIFFDQNMFRTFLNDQTLGTSIVPNGNLFIHGLIATLRFDF